MCNSRTLLTAVPAEFGSTVCTASAASDVSVGSAKHPIDSMLDKAEEKPVPYAIRELYRDTMCRNKSTEPDQLGSVFGALCVHTE